MDIDSHTPDWPGTVQNNDKTSTTPPVLAPAEKTVRSVEESHEYGRTLWPQNTFWYQQFEADDLRVCSFSRHVLFKPAASTFRRLSWAKMHHVECCPFRRVLYQGFGGSSAQNHGLGGDGTLKIGGHLLMFLLL